MIRILQVVTKLSRGGIETMLMNYYRNIDRNEIQFDFLCNNKTKGEYEEEVLSMGGRIYWTPGLNPFKYPEYIRFFRDFVKEHPEYRVIHAHNDAFGAYSLNAAKKVGVPVRIAHIHNAGFPLNYKLPLYYFCRRQLPRCATHLWACGRKAAAFYYGEGALRSGLVHIHNNAIDLDKFIFDSEKRKTVRDRYGISGSSVVLGHVGRFAMQKNHRFLVRIFNEFHKKNGDSFLMLVGTGQLMDEIRNECFKLGLGDAVIFTGNVPDPYVYYQAFDCFLLPSLHEGLPLSGIEAQASDLPCLFSDVVSDEIDILGTSSFLSLDLPADVWAEEVSSLVSQSGPENRRNRKAEISAAGYDIRIEAEKLVATYKKFYSDNAE